MVEPPSRDEARDDSRELGTAGAYTRLACVLPPTVLGALAARGAVVLYGRSNTAGGGLAVRVTREGASSNATGVGLRLRLMIQSSAWPL